MDSQKEYEAMTISLMFKAFHECEIQKMPSRFKRRSDFLGKVKDSPIAFIILIKSFKGKTSNKRLKEAAIKSLEQMKEEKCLPELQEPSTKKVFFYSFAYGGKSVEVASLKIELQK